MNDEWATPQYIFDWLNEEFNFVLDAACNIGNCKCVSGLSINSLRCAWSGYCGWPDSVWLNPPYSNPYPWVKKAYEESQKGCTVVCLLPSNTSTKWFHEWVIGKAEIRLVQGRINFDNPIPGKYNSPTFGSMIAIYGHGIVPKVIGVKRPDRPRG